jgi:hypothetical protein
MGMNEGAIIDALGKFASDAGVHPKVCAMDSACSNRFIAGKIFVRISTSLGPFQTLAFQNSQRHTPIFHRRCCKRWEPIPHCGGWVHSMHHPLLSNLLFQPVSRWRQSLIVDCDVTSSRKRAVAVVFRMAQWTCFTSSCLA